MGDSICVEHERLAKEAYAHLKKLHSLTEKQMEVFESGDRESFMQYDRELENGVGEKERSIGRLRQHDEEHGCQQKGTEGTGASTLLDESGMDGC